jgi:hypothetical protein
MKKIIFSILIFTVFYSQAQVGIGVSTANIETSAQLEVKSTSKGFLPPRMTYSQKSQISSPVAGLIVWCSDCGSHGQLQVYNGNEWTNMNGDTALATLPGAPTIGTVTVSGLSASIPFTAPVSNGGSVITSYTVTASPGGLTGTLNQAGSGSVTINGLTSGVTYTFTVTATNANGTSASSSVSNSVIPVVLTARTLSFEFGGNELPQALYGSTWSEYGSWNSIRSYNGTVRSGQYSWLTQLNYNSSVELINSANFNATSIWVLNQGMGSVSQITIKGYNASNTLVGTVTANVSSMSYQQININLNGLRKIVISSNATYCDMMNNCYDDNGVFIDDLDYEQ